MFENRTLNAIAITESDTTVYDPPLHGLLVLPDATGGNVVVETEKGDEVTFPMAAGLVAPVFIPSRIRKVKAATTMDDAYIFGFKG